MKSLFVIPAALILLAGPAAAAEVALPAPTGVAAVQSGSDVEVTWQPVPEATDYTATAQPGGQTCVSVETACVFTELPAPGTYTFTVVASDGTTTSPDSEPSLPLTVRARLAQPIFDKDTVRIGRSTRGRKIVAKRQGDPLSVNVLFVLGQMHGSEPAGLKVVKRLRKQAVEGDVQIWTVRTMNPDGAKRRNRYNARGVDLNRNFPGTWRRTSRTGYRAASEPETRAMMRFVRKLQPTGVLSFHQPWNTTLSVCDSRSAFWVRRTAALIGLRPPGNPKNCGSWLPGTLNRWTARKTPAWFVTVELAGGRAAKPQIPRSVSAVLTIAGEMSAMEQRPAGVAL